MDLKETGTVGKGSAPEKKKANGKSTSRAMDTGCWAILGAVCADTAAVTLNLSDKDFAQLYSGKANAQNLFMKGKLKIKGDVMKATKLDPILKKAQSKAKL